MSVHTIIDKDGIYFITFTCYGWLPLIELSQGYNTVYNFFTAFNRQGHTVLAYVIMPNHLHLLLHYNGGKSLNTVIGNGKRFMAYEIVSLLEQKGEETLLKKLQAEVKDKDRSRGKKHEIWIDSFDVKECRTEKFILQKLIYIHENPVRGKWKLCDTSLDYPHSSARFYFNGKQQLFEVKDYRDFVKWEKMYE
jgi:REP element-mobilizing transposase RayT